ncbi:dethiobiotin synthase [Kordiimonas laminariae]|uniref:dethiobiotin synthase n=1 Tax=Kordiimonas laminariae TaxID=2917717 RepID=UPI001FF1FE15|nr:dethiobiotin synthase [Kordiimonas laminariae]MCK0069215.1 dethiobiotin synthase [Kordiimonas laminariae]
MNGLFITSTGTEIGKTFVTACLCHQLKAAGKPVHAIKAIISGIEDDMTGTDTAVIAESLGLEPTVSTWNAISPFRYKAPLAPSMAAKLEGKTLDYDALIAFCRKQLNENPFTLVEGVGGSFVPLNDDKLVANWIADLKLDSILVAGSYLGTLSHITATLEAMQARKLPVRAVVISETAGDDHPDFIATIEQVKHWTDIPVIALPRIKTPDLWRVSPDMLSQLNL